VFGPTDEVVDRYEGEAAEGIEASKSAPFAHFLSWIAESRLADDSHTVSAGNEEVTFRFEVELTAAVPDGQLGISFTNAQGLVIFSRHSRLQESRPGRIMLVLTLPSFPPTPGSFAISRPISNVNRPSTAIPPT